jgi:purine-cytosine permease-like protein
MKFSERLIIGPALGIILSAWATAAILLAFLLLSLFMPSFAGIARALSDLMPTDPLAWPIYTT